MPTKQAGQANRCTSTTHIVPRARSDEPPLTKSLIGKYVRFPANTWPGLRVPERGYWTGTITKWNASSGQFACVCDEDRRRYKKASEYTTFWTIEQVKEILDPSQDITLPGIMPTGHVEQNEVVGRHTKRNRSKSTSKSNNLWIGRLVNRYASEWTVTKYFTENAAKNPITGGRTWTLESPTGATHHAQWKYLSEHVILHDTETRENIHATRQGRNQNNSRHTSNKRTKASRAGMRQLPVFQSIQKAPNQPSSAIPPNTPIRPPPSDVLARCTPLSLPTAPQVHPYILRKLIFSKPVWNTPEEAPEGYEWHGTVVGYTHSGRVSCIPTWVATVVEVSGKTAHIPKLQWEPQRGVGLKESLVLLSGETRDTLEPTGHVDLNPAHASLVHQWTHVRTAPISRTKSATPKLKKRKRTPNQADVEYRAQRANKGLSLSNFQERCKSSNVELKEREVVCGTKWETHNGITREHMCSYFTLPARQKIRALVAGLWKQQGRQCVSKFIQNHTRVVPSKHRPRTAGTTISVTDGAIGPIPMRCKYCSLPGVTPCPTTNHDFRQCNQRDAAKRHFVHNAKRKMQMVLPIDGANGTCIPVCQSFFKNTIGVGKWGKHTKAVHKKMLEHAAPHLVEVTNHMGSVGLCKKRKRAIADTLTILKRVRSHYSSNPQNQVDDKYLVDVEDNHFTLWTKTLRRHKPLWVEAAEEYEFYPTHDDVCHHHVCPTNWGVLHPYLHRNVQFPSHWEGWQVEDGFEPAPNGWNGTIIAYHPFDGEWKLRQQKKRRNKRNRPPAEWVWEGKHCREPEPFWEVQVAEPNNEMRHLPIVKWNILRQVLQYPAVRCVVCGVQGIGEHQPDKCKAMGRECKVCMECWSKQPKGLDGGTMKGGLQDICPSCKADMPIEEVGTRHDSMPIEEAAIEEGFSLDAPNVHTIELPQLDCAHVVPELSTFQGKRFARMFFQGDDCNDHSQPPLGIFEGIVTNVIHEDGQEFWAVLYPTDQTREEFDKDDVSHFVTQQFVTPIAWNGTDRARKRLPPTVQPLQQRQPQQLQHEIHQLREESLQDDEATNIDASKSAVRKWRKLLEPHDVLERRGQLDQKPWITYRQHKAEVQTYNVKFGALLVDTCEKCGTLLSQIHDAEQDSGGTVLREKEEALAKHQMLADCSYKAKMADMDRCERCCREHTTIDPTTGAMSPSSALYPPHPTKAPSHLCRPLAIEFQSQDKGGNLKTPDNHRGACYYLSRLDVRPYDIYSHTTQRHTVHLWNELMSEQGANNIISCEHNHHLMYPSGAGWLLKWQDSTVGQCNNLTMCRYLIHITDPKAGMHIYHRIDEKYPTIGHSYLPNDSNIAHMKRKRNRRQVVASIDDWYNIVKAARKTNKNRVHLGKKDMMYNWELFLDQFYVKKLRDNVLLTKYVWRNYGVGDETDFAGVKRPVPHPGEVWLRKTLSGTIPGPNGTEVEEPWVKVAMRRRPWPAHTSDLESFLLYSAPLPLPIKKIAALQKHASLLPLRERHRYETLVQGREAEFLALINEVEGLDSLPIVTRVRETQPTIEPRSFTPLESRTRLEDGALMEQDTRVP